MSALIDVPPARRWPWPTVAVPDGRHVDLLAALGEVDPEGPGPRWPAGAEVLVRVTA